MHFQTKNNIFFDQLWTIKCWKSSQQKRKTVIKRQIIWPEASTKATIKRTQIRKTQSIILQFSPWSFFISNIPKKFNQEVSSRISQKLEQSYPKNESCKGRKTVYNRIQIKRLSCRKIMVEASVIIKKKYWAKSSYGRFWPTFNNFKFIGIWRKSTRGGGRRWKHGWCSDSSVWGMHNTKTFQIKFAQIDYIFNQ